MPGEPCRHNKGEPCVHKPRCRSGYIKPEAAQSREDFSRLSRRNLMAFVRSRGEILSLARGAWDRPKIVRSSIDTPKEVRSRLDLDGLSRDGLRTWIQSRRWTRGITRMKQTGLLDLARRIWDNPDIALQDVRSHADLDGLLRKGLQT